MTNYVKSTFRLALLLLACQLMTACGGSSSNTTVSTDSSTTIFYAHNAAFRNSTAFAWGYNANGQLGIGNAESKSTPVQVNGIVGYTGIVVGGKHTVAFQNFSGGAVKAWGNNYFGELGNGETKSSANPTDVMRGDNTPLISVKDVSAGGNHTLAVRRDGTVWAWGYNGYGQLGLNSVQNISKATQVVGVGVTNPFPANIVQVAAGGAHSLALDGSGAVWGWGYNQSGAIGDGSNTDRSFPVRVVFPVETVITEIAAGGGHSLALDSEGNVWAWGTNEFGQIGQEPQSAQKYSTIPSIVKINGDPLKAVKISAGLVHSLALGKDEKLYAWGYDAYGQLGRGVEFPPPASPDDRHQATPQPVGGISGTIEEIRATGFYSMAFTTNGNVWAWGYNGYNQLGDGTTNSRSIPQKVIGYSFP